MFTTKTYKQYGDTATKIFKEIFDSLDVNAKSIGEVFNDDVSTKTQDAFYNLIMDDKNSTLEIQIALAGYNKDDIKVKFSNSIVEVTTPNGSSFLPKPDDALVKWRGISGKKRVIKFKVSPNTEIIKIKFENGILSIKLKAKEVQEDSKELVIE